MINEFARDIALMVSASAGISFAAGMVYGAMYLAEKSRPVYVPVSKRSGNFKIYYTHIPFGNNRRLNAEIVIAIPNELKIQLNENGEPIPGSRYKFNTAIRKNLSRHRNHQLIDDIDCVAIEDIKPAFTLEDPKKMETQIDEYELKMAEKVDSSNEIEEAA